MKKTLARIDAILVLTLCSTAHAQWTTDALSQARSSLAATTVENTALFAGGARGQLGLPPVPLRVDDDEEIAACKANCAAHVIRSRTR